MPRESTSTTRRRGHHEGSIFQRKDGRWVAEVMLPSGKRRTLYGKTRVEVRDKLKDAQRKLYDGMSLDSDQQTVAHFLDRWLSASVRPSVKYKTYTGYESLCRTAIVPRIGAKKLTKLSPLDLQGLYSELSTSGLSPRTVHHVHRVLHRALGQALRWHLIARNPCDGAQAPRVARAEMKVWTPQQADAFLASTQEHQMHALYVLALTTGMRQGELLGLKWRDLDLGTGTFSVSRALQWQRGIGLAFTEPKTARSRRRIHLSRTALTALRPSGSPNLPSPGRRRDLD
jgi:integrase